MTLYSPKDKIMNTNEEILKEELLTDSIKDREEHYRILIENSPDVIIRFNKELKHIFVNQAIYKAVQLEPRDFLNKSHREMGVFPDHLCQLWEDCINSVFKTGNPEEIEFNLELEHGKIYFEWRLFPEFNEKFPRITKIKIILRKPVYFVCIALYLNQAIKNIELQLPVIHRWN